MAAPQPQQPLRFVKADCDNQMMPENPVMNELLSNIEPAKFCLKVFSKERELQKEIPLKKHAPIYVGRAIGCQIDLVDISISRRHCVFQYKDLLMEPGTRTAMAGFCIYDLKSTHGTFLNGEKVPSMQNIQLRPGDVIRFGLHECDFEFHEIENVEAANPTADSTTEQQAVQEHVEPPPVIQPLEKRVSAFKIISEEIEQINSLPEEERNKKAETMKDELREMFKRLCPNEENPLPNVVPAKHNESSTEPESVKRGRGRGKSTKNNETVPVKKIGRPKRSLDTTAAGNESTLNGEHAEESFKIPARKGRKPKRIAAVVDIDKFQQITPSDFELDPDLLSPTDDGETSTNLVSSQSLTDPLATSPAKQKRQRNQKKANPKSAEKPTKGRQSRAKSLTLHDDSPPVKKRKGRPRKNVSTTEPEEQPLDHGRKGRKRSAAAAEKSLMNGSSAATTTTTPKRRGRKPKSQQQQQQSETSNNNADTSLKRGRKRKVDSEFDDEDQIPLAQRLNAQKKPRTTKNKKKQTFEAADIVKIDTTEQGRIATSPHPKICIPRLSLDHLSGSTEKEQPHEVDVLEE